MTTKEILENFTREEGIAIFNAKKTDKEVYDILVSKGLTDSFETFISEAEKIFTEKVSKMSKEEILAQIEGAELTDEQLEQIAGGDKGENQASDTALIVTGSVVAAAVAPAILFGGAVGAGFGAALCF